MKKAMILMLGATGVVMVGCAQTSTEQAAYRTANPITTHIQNGFADCNVAATVYFDFDSDNLTGESRADLEQVASCLRQGLPMPLHLVGGADPRGTEEYNMALGERRARTARLFLVALGVTEGDISFASVGEELAQGTDEPTWALDRNVSSRYAEGADRLDAPTAALY